MPPHVTRREIPGSLPMSLRGNDMSPSGDLMPTLVRSRTRILAGMLASLLVALPAVAVAQIPAAEFAARRDSLAARVEERCRRRLRRSHAGQRLRSVLSAARLSLSHELRRARRGVRDGRAERARHEHALPHAGRRAHRRSTTVAAPTPRPSCATWACERVPFSALEYVRRFARRRAAPPLHAARLRRRRLRRRRIR